MGGNTNLDSVWWKTTASVPARAPLAGDFYVDVAIVGAGITGLTAAVLLARAGRRVAVVEAERVAAGTSGGTSAHVTQVLDHRSKDLLSSFGEEGVRLVCESTRAGLERIATFVAEERIDCAFTRVPGYLYAESREDLAEIEEELEAARKAGLPVELVRELPLPFPIAGAVRYADQARFDPVAYVAGLAAAAERAGAQIFEGSRVREVHGGEPCRVKTDRGVVTARTVILATHTPAGFDLLQTEIEPMRSYVMAVRLAGQTPPDGLFWDTDDPYHYTRMHTTPEGALLVVGGADHKTGEGDEEASYRDLESYARDHWQVESIPYRWSSQFYDPIDGLPFIGRTFSSEHVLVGTGYSGTGLVLSTVAGMLLSDEALGRENAWADLYRTTRVKPLAGGPKFVATNLDVAKRFVADRVSVPEISDLSELSLGEGRVVEWRGEKVAIYRPESGEIQAVSPVCTHMGCLVHWNSAERSWDCPCHGGRYRTNGEVLEGPPVKGLAPVELGVTAGR